MRQSLQREWREWSGQGIVAVGCWPWWSAQGLCGATSPHAEIARPVRLHHSRCNDTGDGLVLNRG